MLPHILQPGKPVSGYALAIPKAYQPKPINILLKKIFKLFFSTIYIGIILLVFSQGVSSQLNLNSGDNCVLKATGNSDSLNKKYLYINVASGYDFAVMITDVQGGATSFAFNDKSLTAMPLPVKNLIVL